MKGSRIATVVAPLGCVGLLSCATPAEAPFEPLPPREQLIRLSVDLRGVHPSEEELSAIDGTPSLYEGFVDRYLQDARFLDRMEELYNLRFLTRTGETWFDPVEAGILGAPDAVVAASLADEPLKLVRHIIENDLPYSEVVTAAYTMADPIVAAMWDLDYPAGGTAWQAATYRDGRPMAGILSMNTIWQRYPSMGGNANRHRANAVSRMVLCDDYLTRPIVLDRAAIDQLTVDPEEAILGETCQSCHSSLDPLAAHFFGFYRYEGGGDDLRAATLYRPENEEGWRDYANKSPGYFGRPTANLPELGAAIVADPRFTDCAVRTVWEGLTQRELVDEDWAEFQDARDVFEDGGLIIRPLVKEIVLSDAYRAARVKDPAAAQRIATVKTASPAQLASIVADLTGVRWTFGDIEGLTDPTSGLPVLAGGVDGVYVTRPGFNPSVGGVFVLERLAQTAAWTVAAHDLDPARTEAPILLGYVTALDTPDSAPEVFHAQVRALYLRVTGVPLPDDAAEPAQLATLWRQIYSVEASPTAAWAGIVSAVLRDPRVLFY